MCELDIISLYSQPFLTITSHLFTIVSGITPPGEVTTLNPATSPSTWNTMPASGLKYAVIALLITLSAAMSYPHLYQWWQARQNSVQWLTPQQPCRFGSGICVASDGLHTLSVSTTSEHLTAKQAFEIEVTINNLTTKHLAPKHMWLELEGINMYMGVSRYRLEHRGGNRYGMSVRLPTCTVKQMNWRASILAQDTEKTVGYQFEFTADTMV